jgi:hypothetical protein
MCPATKLVFEVSDEIPAEESSAERRARLRAELIERDVGQKTEAFRAEMRGYMDAAGWSVAYAEALKEVLAIIEAGVPQLVTIARQEPSERDAILAARAWWRALRQREADGYAAAAEDLPEFVAYRGEGAEGKE